MKTPTSLRSFADFAVKKNNLNCFWPSGVPQATPQAEAMSALQDYFLRRSGLHRR